MPPLGLNFIKLGLNDVLYDPVSKTFYTPNTNQHATMTGESLQNEENRVIITEKRYNPNRDEKGRFAEGSGSKPEKTKYALSPRRNNAGITVNPKTYGKLFGEFNTKYPNASKNTKGIIYDRKYMYRAKADGEGGIIISQKRILK